MDNIKKLNSFFAFLFWVIFSLTSCEKKIDPTLTQPQEVDTTVELKETLATAKQVFVVAPISVEIPTATSTRETYRNQNGEGYILGYEITTQFPLSIDLTKYSEYAFRIEVLQKNGTYSTLLDSIIESVETTKNPDLNKDGKAQNNEKYTLLKGISKLKSSELENKKSLFEHSVLGRREIVDDSDLPTGRWVPIKNTVSTLKSRDLLKCTIIGQKSTIKEVLAIVDITKFDN